MEPSTSNKWVNGNRLLSWLPPLALLCQWQQIRGGSKNSHRCSISCRIELFSSWGRAGERKMGFWMKLSGFYLENMLTKLGVEGKCFLTVLLTCLTNRTATKQAMKTNFLQFILSFCTSLNVPVTHRSLNNTGRMLSMAKTTSSVTDWTVMASVVDVSFCSVVPAYFGTSKKQFCRRHVPSHSRYLLTQ